MSRSHSKDGFFVDTRLLRDHVSKLREQKKLASRLYSSVLMMQKCSEPSEAYRYRSLLRDVERLIEYYDRMACVLSNASDEAVALSRVIGNRIETDTMHTRHRVSKSLKL